VPPTRCIASTIELILPHNLHVLYGSINSLVDVVDTILCSYIASGFGIDAQEMQTSENFQRVQSASCILHSGDASLKKAVKQQTKMSIPVPLPVPPWFLLLQNGKCLVLMSFCWYRQSLSQFHL
jgi:hypothetical protein